MAQTNATEETVLRSIKFENTGNQAYALGLLGSIGATVDKFIGIAKVLNDAKEDQRKKALGENYIPSVETLLLNALPSAETFFKSLAAPSAEFDELRFTSHTQLVGVKKIDKTEETQS